MMFAFCCVSLQQLTELSTRPWLILKADVCEHQVTLENRLKIGIYEEFFID